MSKQIHIFHVGSLVVVESTGRVDFFECLNSLETAWNDWNIVDSAVMT